MNLNIDQATELIRHTLILALIVSAVLMSMGMMKLPPVLISLPFKILLFVLVDGWGLVTKSLVQSFHV